MSISHEINFVNLFWLIFQNYFLFRNYRRKVEEFILLSFPATQDKSVIVVDTISATITFFAFLGVKIEILASFFSKSAIPGVYRQKLFVYALFEIVKK